MRVDQIRRSDRTERRVRYHARSIQETAHGHPAFDRRDQERLVETGADDPPDGVTRFGNVPD